jgi:hypothetical protein
MDFDFASMWHREHSQLRDNVLSCTGYVIFFGSCPITWASKLQMEIMSSTTESEYITLSSATRDLLPLHQILHDIDQYAVLYPSRDKVRLPSTMVPLPHLTSTKIMLHALCLLLQPPISNLAQSTSASNGITFKTKYRMGIRLS